ncbi:hypothetical protein [Flavobacterium sp.]|uniref:hypothetical protein n=1 Tax=Flavobacterium sp. TaxID=239 RepID=UPI00374CC0D4
MKKSLLLFLLIYKSVLFSQTVLNSYPIDLNKYDEKNQILNVENTTTHDVFAFVVNSKNLTILKYNSALFLKDEFTLSRQNIADKDLIGYSFSEDGNPTLYWSVKDFSTILVIKYYLENKTYKILSFKYPSSQEYVVGAFQKNNLFYLISKEISKPALTSYTFTNGTVEERIFDFSEFTFQNRKTQSLTFSQILAENPIEKIESDEYSPLDKSTKKSKMYIMNNHLILTFDHNPKETQIFDLNLENHEIIEKKIPQSVTQSAKRLSNSFFYNNKIYQINATQEELLLDIKDYNSGETLKTFKVSQNDTIRFKSSPLLMQRDIEKPRELKKTSKFLQRLSNTDIGLSVFKSNENTLITLGGIPRMEQIMYAVNDGFNSWDYTQTFHNETVFFESTLNQNNEFVNLIQQPLALDNINYFLDHNRKATLPSIIKFKNYYILGYYDTSKKQYLMRKFTDGFIPEEPRNPIIDKAAFSKSFPVENP